MLFQLKKKMVLNVHYKKKIVLQIVKNQQL